MYSAPVLLHHVAMTLDPSTVPRIVLDTNVCLDLFLFRDPACAPLLAALQAGSVQAVTREDCRAEWLRVLHYPQLPIEPAMWPALTLAFDGLIRLLPPESATPPETVQLPRCADADDQKFLELACAAGARWLLSKDNELLKLARRSRSAGLFSILLPQDWTMATD